MLARFPQVRQHLSGVAFHRARSGAVSVQVSASKDWKLAVRASHTMSPRQALPPSVYEMDKYCPKGLQA
jgi:hypothetical protein